MHNTLDQPSVLSVQAADAVEMQSGYLRHCTERALKNYFSQLEDIVPSNLYELVLAEIEIPLLEVVLQRTAGNQTKAAKILGLSRGTLRKKLKKYNLE